MKFFFQILTGSAYIVGTLYFIFHPWIIIRVVAETLSTGISGSGTLFVIGIVCGFFMLGYWIIKDVILELRARWKKKKT